MDSRSKAEESSARLTPQQRTLVLGLARDSIASGVRGEPLREPELASQPPELTDRLACFVTLHKAGNLRGCIGTLTARRSLLTEVVHMARAAAFEDPRFAAVSSAELAGLRISVSVLSPATPLQFASEHDLVAQLRPGRDGLVLREGAYSGTFLPSVWEKLPEPAEFLRHLKRKAGLSPDHWSDRLTVERYTTESFEEP